MIRSVFSLLRSAALVGCAIVLGYAVGTVAILAVLSASFDPYQSISKPWELFADDMLRWRYRFEGFDHRYSDTWHYSITASVLFVFGLAISVRVLALSVSLWFAPAVVRRTDGPDYARKRRIWGRALQSAQRSPSLRGLGLLFVVSMIGAWVCFGADGLIMEIRQRLWMRNPMANPGFDPTPRPVVGWMTWADVVWITAVVVWADWVWLVRAARRRVLGSRYVAKRWCGRCGYPLLAAGAAGTGGRVCSECGEGSPALTLGARQRPRR